MQFREDLDANKAKEDLPQYVHVILRRFARNTKPPGWLNDYVLTKAESNYAYSISNYVQYDHLSHNL